MSITTPITDPTMLTTIQLDRGLVALREVIEARVTALENNDEHVRGFLDQRHAAIKTEVDRLQELHEEKFRSIAVQFAERDTRTEQTSRDSKVAVDAALQAAKEAVGEQNKSSALAIAKSEAATTKQIDQILVIIQSTTGGLNDKIDDIKSRLTLIEGRAGGISASWGVLVGVMVVVGIVVGMIVKLIH